MNTKKCFLLLFIFFQSHIFFDISAMEEDSNDQQQQQQQENLGNNNNNNPQQPKKEESRFYDDPISYFNSEWYPKFKAAQWFWQRFREGDLVQFQVDYYNQKDKESKPFKDAEGKEKVPQSITDAHLKALRRGNSIGKNIRDSVEDSILSGIGTGTGEGISYLIKKGIDRLIPNQPTPQEMIQNKHNEKEAIMKQIESINTTISRSESEGITKDYRELLIKKQERLHRELDRVKHRTTILAVENSNDVASRFIAWFLDAAPEENENIENELIELKREDEDLKYYDEAKNYNLYEISDPIKKYREDMKKATTEVYDPGTNKNMIRYKVEIPNREDASKNDILFLTKEEYVKRFAPPQHFDTSPIEIKEFFAEPYVKLAKEYINKINDFNNTLYKEGIIEKDPNTNKDRKKPHFDIIAQSKSAQIALFKEEYEQDLIKKSQLLIQLKKEITEKSKEDNISDQSKKLYAELLSDIDKTHAQLIRNKRAAKDILNRKLYASSQRERQESMKNGFLQQTQRFVKDHPTATKWIQGVGGTVITGILLYIGKDQYDRYMGKK